MTHHNSTNLLLCYAPVYFVFGVALVVALFSDIDDDGIHCFVEVVRASVLRDC